MKKLLVALVFAGCAVAPGGVASADHCFDGVPPNFPDPGCDWIHDLCERLALQEECSIFQD